MQNFVNRGRTGSPSNGLSQGKPDRQANAASARIAMKDGHPVQQSQAPSGVPARGFTNAQNSSAVLQQPLQHRQSGPGPSQKRDPYDTDAESIDTTVNQSVVQVEDSQRKERHHQQRGHVVGFDESSEVEDGDEEDEYEYEEEEEPEHPYWTDDYKLTHYDQELLRANGLATCSYDVQLSFLQDAARSGFQTVEGDSYPSTTNGEISEWGGGQEAPSNFHDDGRPMSPSPQRQNINNQAARMAASQPPQQQQSQNISVPSQTMQKPSQLYQHGAQIREQLRATAPILQHAAPSARQHQTHNRNKPHPTAIIPVQSNLHPSTYAQLSRSQQKPIQQASGPRTQLPPNKNTIPIGPPAPLKRPFPAPVIREPVVQEQPIEQTPFEGPEAVPHEDYDQKTLLKMKYEELKSEPFDADPRAPPPVLAEEDLQKPLAERLPLVKKNLDVGQQSEFFRSLPTTEWEDAGDWFLDQFQNIVQRIRQARQKKRKLAQDFEAEVEKRYEHVSKRQNQVQHAMDRMKEQGEGLVPRSPKPSKSPRPKRG
jgi:hypothetical protein